MKVRRRRVVVLATAVMMLLAGHTATTLANDKHWVEVVFIAVLAIGMITLSFLVRERSGE